MSRTVAATVGAVVVVVGVVLLREQTMTRDEPPVPGTATEVVVCAATRDREPAATVTELTRALVLTCRLEVDAEPVSDLERMTAGRHQYRVWPPIRRRSSRALRRAEAGGPPLGPRTGDERRSRSPQVRGKAPDWCASDESLGTQSP